MTRTLRAIAVLYPLMMILTFGHAAKQTYKETMDDCRDVHELYRAFYCSPPEMSYRSEAIGLSIIWPYYWSEVAWKQIQ